MCTPSNTYFLEPIRVQTASRSVQSFFSQLTVEVLTLYNGPPLALSNCTYAWGIWTPSNTCFLGPTPLRIPNGISIASAVFAQLTADSPILYNRSSLYTSKLSIRMVSGSHLMNHWTHLSPQPRRHLDRFSRFYRARDLDRQTDRPHYSVCNNRPHLRRPIHSTVMRLTCCWWMFMKLGE